mgnify:CR=1 FL=1
MIPEVPPGGAPGAGPEVPLLVAVDPDRFADVVRRLADTGLTVRDRHPHLGMVTGEAPPELIPLLEAVDGVAAVERQRQVGVQPPDSPVQ